MARKKRDADVEGHRCDACGAPVEQTEEEKKIETLKKRRAVLEDELGRVINELAQLGGL